MKVSSWPAWPREGPASFSGCLSQGSKVPINRLWPPKAWFWADEYRWTDGVGHSFIHQSQLLNCPKALCLLP